MQKKNLEIPTPSNELMTPSIGLAEIIPNQMPGNTASPLPSDGSTLELDPSTSDSSVQAPQKVNQSILNQVVQKHLSTQKFPESTDVFFKSLEKYGYSKDQVEKAKKYNQSLLLKKNPDATNQMELNGDYVQETAGEIKKQEDKENFNDINPVVGSVLKVGKKADEYLNNQTLGVELGGKQMFKALQKQGSDIASIADGEKPIIEKLGDIGTDVLNAASGGFKAGFSLAGAAVPEMIAFNAGTEALHSLPDDVKASVVGMASPGLQDYTGGGAEKFDKIIDFPFTAATSIAGAMGRHPGEGSAELAVYDILNVLIPLGAHKAVSGSVGTIKDINSLKEISDKIKNGEATEADIKSVVDLSESIKEIPVDVVKAAVVKQKLDKYLQIPNDEIMKVSMEGETPETIREKVNELSTQIKEEQDPAKQQELADNQKQLHALADAIEVHDDVAKYPKQYIEAIKSDETIPEDQKQIYIDQITNSTQLDAGIRNVEDAKIDHISNIEALKDPGSKEFYSKAMQALDDPGVVDRVKKSLDEAVKSGEINLDEANANLAHFEKVVDIDKSIPEKISDPEDRITASKLIEKKQKIKESVQGKDSVLAAKEITSAKLRIENVDEKLKDIVDQAKEKSKNISIEPNKSFIVQGRKLFDIKSNNENVGSIGLEENDNHYNVTSVKIKNEKQGIGTQAYKQLIESLDKPLFSDLIRSDAANSLWNKLVKDGYAEFNKNENRYESIKKESPEKRVHAIWKNALLEMKDENLKKGIQDKGIEYLVKHEAVGESSARDVIDAAVKADKLTDVENIVLDEKNGMEGTNRGVISALLGNHYFELSKKAVDASEKQSYQDKFYNYTKRAAELATEGGQSGNAIGKIIKKLYINDPQTAITEYKMRLDKRNEKVLEPHQEKIKNTYESIKDILATEEGQKAVTEEISKKSERLFGKETQKKIIDLFDKAKIDTKGKLFDATAGLPIAAYNTAVEVMKQAALLGAKGAAIIEEGVSKIRELHKEDWDDTAFRKEWEEKLRDSGVNFGKKRSVTPKETASILDVIEKKADRLKPKNRDKFLKDVILEVENEGGLSEQRFKDLYAKALGLETMTPELAEKIQSLSKSIKEAEDARTNLSNAYDRFINKESSESEKSLSEAKSEFNDLARKADIAQSELSSILRDKKDFADTFISSIQTNLLTPISLARNIVGVLPDVTMFRPVTNLTAGGIDFMVKTAENMGAISKRTESSGGIAPLARTKGAWLALPDAARNFYTAILTGETPGKFGERSEFKKIEPGKAAKRIYDALAKDKKMSGQDWASSIIESTAGVPGSIIGKLLIGPDTFFRTVAEQSKLYEAGVSKGLKGAELEKFVKLPDEGAMADAKAYADEVTYQGDNKVSKVISSLKSSLKTKEGDSGMVDFAKQSARILGTTFAPYIKTPSNVLWESVKLLYPEISIGQGLKEMKNGNRVEAERHFAKAVTGFALRHVVGDMAAAGIIKPATNYDDKKERSVEDSGGKVGGQVNYSRMMRYLTLHDEGEKPTDVWVDYKWLGPLGLVMGTQASIEKEDKESSYPEEMGKRGTYALKYTSELPYIQSMGTVADALRDPQKKTNPIIANVLSTISSGVVPRTVTQLSQASEPNKKVIYDKDLGQYIKNKFKYDYFSGDDLPSKINIWGEKISNAPKDNNPYAWYVLNFYKDRNPDENSLSYKLQELMDKTDNKDVVPSVPVNTININKQKVLLDPKEYEDYQTFVGRTRSQLTKAYIDHGAFEADNEDKKIETLQNIYREGASQGKNMLISSSKRLSQISGNMSIAGNKRSRGKRKRG